MLRTLVTQLSSILRLIKLDAAEALPAMNRALIVSNRMRGSDSELQQTLSRRSADAVRATWTSLRSHVCRNNHVAQQDARRAADTAELVMRGLDENDD